MKTECAKANPKRLHNGFFGSEPSGVPFRRVMALLCVCLLTWGEAFAKGWSALQDLAHTVDFDGVDADAHNHGA